MAAIVHIGDWVIASTRKIWSPGELAAAQEAVGLMEQAAERARQIVAEAEREAERIRSTAQSEGFRAGEVQALRRVLTRMGGQETLVQAVRAFIMQAVSESTASLMASDTDPARYRRLLETVEGTLTGWTWISMRVAPACLDEAAAVVASIQTTLTDRVTLSADESLRPGECVIESDAGWLDGRLETQLEQVRAALSGLLNTAGYHPSEP